jgi:hypothetical protein
MQAATSRLLLQWTRTAELSANRIKLPERGFEKGFSQQNIEESRLSKATHGNTCNSLDPILDCVCDMGHHLDSLAEIIAPSFPINHRLQREDKRYVAWFGNLGEENPQGVNNLAQTYGAENQL